MHAQLIYYLIIYGAADSGNRKHTGSSFHCSQTRVYLYILFFLFRKCNIFIPHFHAISEALFNFKCMYILRVVTLNETHFLTTGPTEGTSQ